jgi:HD-like signal output (HDOD) protein
MWTRIRQLFGGSSRDLPAPAPVAATPMAPPPRATAGRASPSRSDVRTDSTTLLPARLVGFLEQFTSRAEPMAAEDLAGDDILFLEGLIRRLEAAQLEVAMLPDVTLRLTEMLRHGDVPVTQYVALINKDASLSIEVLKAANSAFYANTARTSSLHEAVMRIGLTRLQSILMLTLMKTRVLKAGTLRAHAELMIDMSLPLASLAGAVARSTHGPADLCFMRGMLLHVEHLMVLGTISETSKEHRAIITPSTDALLLAFHRAGADVRRALAHAWGIEDILLKWADDGDGVDYDGLRVALVRRWLRQPLPQVAGVHPDLLEDLLSHVAPRVQEPQDDTDTDTPEELSA